MLLREESLAAITHADPVIRTQALELVTECRAADGLDATHQSIRALEAHGLGAFQFHHQLTHLPLDEESAGKILRLLSDLVSRSDKENDGRHLLTWILDQAPAPFLRDHRAAIGQSRMPPDCGKPRHPPHHTGPGPRRPRTLASHERARIQPNGLHPEF